MGTGPVRACMRLGPVPLALALLVGVSPEVRAQGQVVIGQTISGQLTEASPVQMSGRRYALWTFQGVAGQHIVIEMRSSQFDSYVVLQDQNGNELARNDDGAGGLDSRIEVTLPYTGTFRVVATTFSAGEVAGAYTLSLMGQQVGAMAVPRPPPLPQFPWPPPPATVRDVIPRGLVTRPPAAGAAPTIDTLGPVADSIENALRRAGIEWAVYVIGDSGFAYVTQAEMIGRSGEPFPPPERFPTDVETATGSRGFLEYIVSRFRARPGYFRVIALLVTSRPIAPAGAPLTVDSATALVHGGMRTVPPALRRREVRDLEAEAHVYEFERPTAADSVTLRTAGLLGARAHLAAAGLWTPSQLGGVR